VVTGFPTASFADDVHCPPFLGRVTIDGNVLVAAPCRLKGTIVIGNVHLYAGGSLVSRQGTQIGGSIQAENSDFVDLLETQVNGNIQLDDLVGDRSIINRSTIGGSIQLVGNRSRLEVLGNTVNADVQAFSNTGGVIIADNIIDGNLQCKSNNPPPAGGNNRVRGNKEDQCAHLMPEEVGPTPAPAPVVPARASGGGGGGLDLHALLLMALLLASRRVPAKPGARQVTRRV
jgi:hypothetical protein